MKLTIVAATGGIGRHALEQAVAAGHHVTAVVRSPRKLAGPSPGRPTPPKHDPGDGFFMRHLFSHVAETAFRTTYADLTLMEDVLRDSRLDWTVVRPPKLTDKPLTGTYRTAYGQNLRGGWSVPRADVADLMLRVLEQPATIRQVIGVAT